MDKEYNDGAHEEVEGIRSLGTIPLNPKDLTLIFGKLGNAYSDHNEIQNLLAEAKEKKDLTSILAFRDDSNKTILHYAVAKNLLGTLKYFIKHGAKVNAIDNTGITPLHSAAQLGYREIVQVLLENGAEFHILDCNGRKPLDMTTDGKLIKQFSATEKLIDSAEREDADAVESAISEGAFLDAKSADGTTALHIAARQGHEKIIDVLLKKKANSNVADSKGEVPLHYAAKSGHAKCVKLLLSHGASYDVVSSDGKTPCDVSEDQSVKHIFEFIHGLFKDYENGSLVLRDCLKAKDIELFKIMRLARNKDNKTLDEVGDRHKSAKDYAQMKRLLESDVDVQYSTADCLANEERYDEAFNLLRRAMKQTDRIFGPDSRSSLLIQWRIGKITHKQGKLNDALLIFRDVLKRQRNKFDECHEDVLKTRRSIAFTLTQLGRNEEACQIYEDVYLKQSKVFDPSHLELMHTQLEMAPVQATVGKYEEALNTATSVYERYRDAIGDMDPDTMKAQFNIGVVLHHSGKPAEALQVWKAVLAKDKKVLGGHHVGTLKTMGCIASAYMQLDQLDVALNLFEKVLKVQKARLIPNHGDTLMTQFHIALVLTEQGKKIAGYRAHKECLNQRIAVFGPSHPSVKMSIEQMNVFTQFYGDVDILAAVHAEFRSEAAAGKAKSVQTFIDHGADVNDRDPNGWSALNFATNNGQKDVVSILLNNGADVAAVTNKGNTPLHTAALKKNHDIAAMLLQHVDSEKLSSFVNAKTVATGTTALHVAAKTGSVDMVKLLLMFGAIYGIKNNEGQMPVDDTTNKDIVRILKSIDTLFQRVANGVSNVECQMNDLLKPDEISAALRARNNDGKTMLEVAKCFDYSHIADVLSKMSLN